MCVFIKEYLTAITNSLDSIWPRAYLSPVIKRYKKVASYDKLYILGLDSRTDDQERELEEFPINRNLIRFSIHHRA